MSRLFVVVALGVLGCGPPARAPTSTRDACRSVIAALDASPKASADDYELRATILDDERRRVEAAGLRDDAGSAALHETRASEASAAIRRLGALATGPVEPEAVDFIGAFDAYQNDCLAHTAGQDCYLIIALVGRHVLQLHGVIDADAVLAIADLLDQYPLTDPASKPALDRLVLAARHSTIVLGKQLSGKDEIGDARAEVTRDMAALDEARDSLRLRCRR